MSSYVAGIDLGGTKIGSCIMDAGGRILARETLPTLAHEGPEAVVGRMKKTVYDLIEMTHMDKKQIAAIGIGVPGPLDRNRGIVKNPPNLPGWHDIPLIALMRDEFDLPVVMENDANAAALAENLYGAGKNVRNFMYITVSTGIGGGFVVDGKLLTGEYGNAVEIGHTTINFDGPRCGCGNRGCWEAYASGTALARFAREGIRAGRNSRIVEMAGQEGIKAEHVFAAAKEGDEFALELVEKEAFYLGVGLANVVNTYNPGLIAMGGGLTNEWDMFYETMIRVMKERALKANTEDLRVVKAALGTDAGIIGAAAVAWSTQK
jgi:glucokinase